MKSLASKIVLFSVTFLVLSLVIGFIAYDQVKYRPQVYTSQQEEVICGNETSSSENHQKGEAIFKANCAACHKKYKDAYGPALQRFVKSTDSLSLQYLSIYFMDQHKLNATKKYNKETGLSEDTSNFIHQQILNETEIIQLLEYITD